MGQAVREMWQEPLEGCDDPLRCLRKSLEGAMAGLDAAALALGCSLNHLAQEMSASDEEFRERICAAYSAWSGGRGLAKTTAVSGR